MFPKNMDVMRTAAGWFKFMTSKAALGPWVPLQPKAVQAVLRFGQLKRGETMHDLGCGDGRVVVAAARDFGAGRAVGHELDASLIGECKAAARAAGVEDKCEFRQGDARAADVSSADLITLYLSVPGNAALLPLLRKQLQLRPGARVVSFQFEIESLQPARVESFSGVPMRLYDASSLGDGDASPSETGIAQEPRQQPAGSDDARGKR